MGNSNSKKNESDEVDEVDEVIKMYSDIELKIDTDKIKRNLKKYKTKEELIILIESGALAPPHKMHIGLMEIVKKYMEENSNKKVVGGYLIPRVMNM